MLETEQKDRADTYNNNKYNESIKDNNRPDIVLLQLPLWGMFHPPLALGLLKSSLKHNGISCKTFDLNAHTFSTRGKKYFDLWHLKHTFTEQFWNRKKMIEFYREHRPIMLYYINEIKRLKPKIVGCSIHDTSKLVTEIFLEDLFAMISPGGRVVLSVPSLSFLESSWDKILGHFRRYDKKALRLLFSEFDSSDNQLINLLEPLLKAFSFLLNKLSHVPSDISIKASPLSTTPL